MTPTQQSTIIAVFPDASAAQAAARDLLAIGVSRENMYLESSGGATAGASGTTSGSSSYTDEPGTEMPAHHGGVSGWFKSLFGAEDDTERSRYENAVGRGNVILSVHARQDQHDAIADVLERHNPINLHGDEAASSSAAATGSTGARPAAAATGRAGKAAEGSAIPVVDEELQVGKRRTLRGGVRVYSHVVERPVEESIELTEDRVRVDRRPVDRPATEAELRNTRDNVVEVQEYAEEAVVAKTARVVEEVVVGKETTHRTENVRDTVRHTEVNVEQLPGNQGAAGTTAGYDDTDFRNDFQTRYASSGGSYEDYAPSYRYGYEMASDPRYRGQSFDEVESQLRSDYGNRYPNSTWERFKDSVRYGWDKVTGRTKAAGR
ncbi:MAG TPA: YsnF/AvaK domain-containing protein [Bryobacteraceae bacterium]|nr:YsnF/AvaK domain-containing protein [Bryobacteraceae bacterium]